LHTWNRPYSVLLPHRWIGFANVWVEFLCLCLWERLVCSLLFLCCPFLLVASRQHWPRFGKHSLICFLQCVVFVSLLP
jgi:hypothetical protein